MTKLPLNGKLRHVGSELTGRFPFGSLPGLRGHSWQCRLTAPDLNQMLGWFRKEVFMGAAQRKLFRRGLPILAYHKIASPQRSRDPFLYTRPESFNQQLDSLKQSGFIFGTLDAIHKSQPGKNREVVITFDDGFRNAFENTLAVLEEANAPAIQFIVSSLIGGQNEWDISKGDVAESLMDESQIKTWLTAGHQIGSHSMTHRNLKKLSPKEAREEIFSSKKVLEDRFGIEVKHFSYPFGGWNPQVRDWVAEAGYFTACSMDFGVNNVDSGAFVLRRIIPLSEGNLLRKVVHRLLHGRGQKFLAGKSAPAKDY